MDPTLERAPAVRAPFTGNLCNLLFCALSIALDLCQVLHKLIAQKIFSNSGCFLSSQQDLFSYFRHMSRHCSQILLIVSTERKLCPPHRLLGWARRGGQTAGEERSEYQLAVPGGGGGNLLSGQKKTPLCLSEPIWKHGPYSRCRMALLPSTWLLRRITWRWCDTCWKMMGTKALPLR